MSEDRFFQQVKATMADYSPEVPESVYMGVRKKLWWSNFTRLSATRFNIWYVVVLITSAAAIAMVSSSAEQAVTENAGQQTTVTEVSDAPVTSTGNAQLPETVAVHEQPSEQTTVSRTEEKGAITKHSSELTDLVAEESETSSQPDPNTSENSNVTASQSSAANESSESKPSAKKGLKVKTYKSDDK